MHYRATTHPSALSMTFLDEDWASDNIVNCGFYKTGNCNSFKHKLWTHVVAATSKAIQIPSKGVTNLSQGKTNASTIGGFGQHVS